MAKLSKNQKNVIVGVLIVGVLLFFGLLPSVSAEAVCMDAVNLCTNAYLYNGNWYCNLEYSIACPRIWDPTNQMWLGGCSSNPSGDDFCANTTSPVPPPTCSQGYMECQNGDPYKCTDGYNWVKQDECGTNLCVEQSYNYAYCKIPMYYCLGIVDCFTSSVKNSNCFDTLTECRNNLGFCCKDSSTGVRTWRIGSCLSNELPLQGTDINKDNCRILDCKFKNPEDCRPNVFALCTEKECSACNWTYIPDALFNSGKCTNETVYPKCKSCDDFALSYLLGSIWEAKSCDAKGWNLQWSFFFITPPQGTTTCLLSLIKLILVPIVFVFGFLFLNQLLEDKFRSMKGKQGRLYRMIIALIFSALIAVLVYLAFIIGLVIFILVVLIKTAFPVAMTYITKGGA